MTIIEYNYLKEKIFTLGFEHEVKMINDYLDSPCKTSTIFLKEYIWVIINAGLKNTVAEFIFYKIMYAISKNYKLDNVFKHAQKMKAIHYLIDNHEDLFRSYCSCEDKLQFLETLPFIGPATKYHLGRNLGLNVCKPDRHLIRIAKYYNLTPFSLCDQLAEQTSDRVGVIDVVLWRAGTLRLI